MENRVYFLLDRSGSMIADDTIKGFNTFMKQQDPNTLLTLYLFDHEFTVVFRNVPIRDVKPLKYRPRGGTELYGAITKAIDDIENDLPRLWSEQEDVNITVVILTDGEDNGITKYKLEDIGYIISFKRMSGWEFLFAGASDNTHRITSEMSINKDSVIFFDTDEIIDAFDRIGYLVAKRNACHATLDA